MTVAELIEKLKLYDQDRTVIFTPASELEQNSDKFILADGELSIDKEGIVHPFVAYDATQIISIYVLEANTFDNELWKMRYLFNV